jgi:hypothetical protein
MRSPGVYSGAGVNPEDGRRWGRRCPRLAQRGHGCWYFTVDLPAGRNGDRRRLRRAVSPPGPLQSRPERIGWARMSIRI